MPRTTAEPLTRPLLLGLTLLLGACASSDTPVERPAPNTVTYGNTTITTGGSVAVETVYVSARRR